MDYTPDNLRLEAEVERISGHTAQASMIDGMASAWEADRKKLEEAETKLAMAEMALRVSGLPLPPYGAALAPNDTSPASQDASPGGQTIASVLVDTEDDAYKVWAKAYAGARKHWNEECARNYDLIVRIAQHMIETTCPECSTPLTTNRCPHCQGL